MAQNFDQDPTYQAFRQQCLLIDVKGTGRIPKKRFIELLQAVDGDLQAQEINEKMRFADEEGDDIIYQTSIPKVLELE